MSDATSTTPAETTRTARFAQFLRAAVAIKTKAVTEVNKYPTVIWFSNLPTGLDEVRSPLLSPNWPADDVRWLVVSRVWEVADDTDNAVAVTYVDRTSAETSGSSSSIR